MSVIEAPPDLEPIALAEPDDPTVPRRGLVAHVFHGPEADPAWARPALLVLLGVTAVLYLWNLGASGYANTYYSAAVQAGTQSWKAFLFGSTDASNFITVDKTPAALWPMEISARIFGVNSWSILAPQALEGVAAVGLLYATIKRWFGAPAGLIAGTVMALTPVAALMFRFNNPDALLVLLLTLGAYAMTRAVEDGRTRWLVLAGAAAGFGFLAKELQAFVVLPAFGLAYLIAGPPQLGRRIAQLAVLGVSTVLAAGWWVAIAVLTPAGSRPYIGGSQNNSFWNVLFGYNGFGRLTGNENGSVGGGAAGTTGRWGATGLTRMFNESFGAQASWLLPAALLLLGTGLAFTIRRARTDRTRAALVLWGGWLVLTVVVFSLGQGIIHEYYTVALAPTIGAVVGIGVTTLWRYRDQLFARIQLAVVIGVTAVWGYVLLGHAQNWHPELRTFMLVGGLAGAILVLVTPQVRGRAAVAIAIGALVVGLAAPAAYTLSTVNTPHNGAIPIAGPAAARTGPGGGGGGPRAFGGPGGNGGTFAPPSIGGTFTPPNLGGNGTFTPPNPGGANSGSFTPPNGAAGGAPGGGARGGMGGLLNGTAVSDEASALLQDGTAGYRWSAAAIGANNAASYQLASGEAIMAIGGFNGTDPTPTLAQFQEYVANHEVHYFISGGGGMGAGLGGGSEASTSSQISQWVQANFTAQTVGGMTLYDLST